MDTVLKVVFVDFAYGVISRAWSQKGSVVLLGNISILPRATNNHEVITELDQHSYGSGQYSVRKQT